MVLRLPPAELAYLESVVDTLRAILGDTLTAVYPVGSIALDGYRPGRSDIDLIALVDRVPPASVIRAVAARLCHDELPCPATGLEFVLYPSETVNGVGAGYLLDLNTGRELPPRVGLDPAQGPRFWYVIDRAICYQSDETLYGPPPHTVLRPVPFGSLLPVVVESVRAHAAEITGQGDNAVLNGCRALWFGEHRRWYTKPAAATWALTAAPDFRPLIASAIASHRVSRVASRAAADDTAAVPDDAAAFLAYVVQRLDRLAD
jgi:hypothetical protein